MDRKVLENLCGIGGLVCPKATPAWRKQVLRDLLIGSTSRGKAATGIAFVDPEKGLIVAKDGKEANDFVKLPVFTDVVGYLPPIVLAHTRAATGGPAAGPDKNENNHPFSGKLSKIALIHNGSCEDEHWRKTVGKPDGIGEKFQFEGNTDSELFLRMLETCLDDGSNPSMLDALSDSLYNIEGSYALAIIRESEPNKVWLARHKNPIVIAYQPKAQYLIFGSTREIIEYALTDYRFTMNFFTEKTLPRLLFEEVTEDHIVEITVLDKPNELGELFSIHDQKFMPHAEHSSSYYPS